MSDLTGWLAVILAVLAIYVSRRDRSQDTTEKDVLKKQEDAEAKMRNLVAPLENDLEQHKLWHAMHFSSINGMREDIASLLQQQKDHIAHDDERFVALNEMNVEMRDDVKSLLRATAAIAANQQILASNQQLMLKIPESGKTQIP